MQVNPRYTSAVANQPFLYAETLIVAQRLREGQDWESLKSAVRQENLLHCQSQASRKHYFQALRARLKDVDPLILDLLLDSPPQVAKWVNFFVCLQYYRLLRELMAELVLPQFQRGNTRLSAFEVDEFFARKRQQEDVLHRWQDSTFVKVKSNTLGLAVAAEILSGPAQGPWQIARGLLPPQLVSGLQALGRAAFIPLLGRV